MRSPPPIILRMRYVMSGTETSYDAIRSTGASRNPPPLPGSIVLDACAMRCPALTKRLAMFGTDIAYACHTMCCTDIAYAPTSLESILR